MKKNPINHLLILACLFLVLPISLFSQTGNIISLANWDDSELSYEQNQIYQKLQSPLYTGLTKVDIGHLQNNQLDGRIKINTGSLDCGTVTYKVKRAEYLSEADYMWYGEVESSTQCSCSNGDLLLISKDGRKYGSISVEGDEMEIIELGGGKNVIVQPFDNGNTLSCGGTIPSFSDNNDIVDTRGPGNCTVKVLFVYTNGVATSIVTNLPDKVNTYLAYMNNVLGNSAIHSSKLRFQLAGLEQVNYNENSNDLLENVLTDIRVNQEANDFRDLYDADIVVILVDPFSLSPNDGAGGVAFTGSLDQPASNVSAYTAIGIIGNPNLNNTITHEVGHILGCKHEPCNSGSAGDNCNDNTSVAHAHAYVPNCSDSDVNRTVMISYTNDFTIPYFSNPEVSYEGNPTGTPSRNNANVLKNNACTVANYRSTSNDLSVGFVGDQFGCPGGIVSLIADVIGAPGSYQYEWRVSINGGATGSVISTQSFANIVLTPTVGDVISVYLKVTASDGNIHSNWHHITVVGPLSLLHPCSENEIISNNENYSFKKDFQIIPNPASNQSFIKVNLDEPTFIKTAIYSVDGKMQFEIKGSQFSEGEQLISLYAKI